MFPKQTAFVQFMRACPRAACRPVKIHSRSIWDLVRFPESRNIVREMNRELERMERNMFRSFPFNFALPRLVPIDSSAVQRNSYRINIDVEGYKAEDIKISIKNNVMRIEAQMDAKSEDGSRLKQSFVREITIPENVDQSTLKSLFHDDGVLTIEARVIDKEGPKDIPITHEAETLKSKI